MNDVPELLNHMWPADSRQSSSEQHEEIKTSLIWQWNVCLNIFSSGPKSEDVFLFPAHFTDL